MRNGNCLYSSVSLALLGDNSITNELRILTSLELVLYSEYYVSHPYFDEVFNKKPNITSCKENLFLMSLSNEASGLGSNMQLKNLVLRLC